MEKVIIIGAGPAGISAALYAVRGNLDPLVINNGIGALEKAEKIENYYGLEHPLSGQELYDTGIAQAKALGVRILDAQVLGVGGFDTFVVKTTEGEFETQSLILATGSKRAAPKIPGVKEFEGKGVSYCAICDAFFYRGKDVAVLGNGDFAMHEAKELSNTASTVTIYTNGEEPKFTPEENISVNTMKIQSVEGDDLVSGIRLEPDVQAEEIKAEAGQQANDFCPAEGTLCRTEIICLLTCFCLYFLCLHIRFKTDSGYQIIALYRLDLHCVYTDIFFRCKFRFFTVCINGYCRSSI